MSVPIATSPGRGGFGPQLPLSYDSGAGNGLFGLGWSLSLPATTRKTEKGLPRYIHALESDVFILAGVEDFVPVLDATGKRAEPTRCTVYGTDYSIQCYRPRIEGLFALIERWMEDGKPANTFWRTISQGNITTWYGRTAESRIADPADGARIFQWLIFETHDDKGNVVAYGYAREDGARIVTTSVEALTAMGSCGAAYATTSSERPAASSIYALVWPKDVAEQRFVFPAPRPS